MAKKIKHACADVGGTFTDRLMFEAARDAYKVVVNPMTFQINEARIRARKNCQ